MLKHLVHLGFQQSRNCISQPRYVSRMNFNIRGQCNFIFHNLCCTLPKDTTDVEVTIWTVDGIHTYRSDRMNQAVSYSPLSRQVKPFPSLRKKITEYQEQKRRSFNPFNPVRELILARKEVRDHRRWGSTGSWTWDITPCRAASTCPTTTATTTTVNLSSPSNLPSFLDVPQLPAPSKPSKMWARPYPTLVLLSSPAHSDWSSEED